MHRIDMSFGQAFCCCCCRWCYCYVMAIIIININLMKPKCVASSHKNHHFIRMQTNKRNNLPTVRIFIYNMNNECVIKNVCDSLLFCIKNAHSKLPLFSCVYHSLFTSPTPKYRILCWAFHIFSSSLWFLFLP